MGGGVKEYMSVEQGAKVSTATQRAETTTRHRNIEKISGDTYQPLFSAMQTKEEGRGGGGATCHTKARFEANDN